MPEQPSFEGSRQQFRGRTVRLLGEYGETALDALGHRIRVDCAPGGERGRAWLRGLVDDLDDGGPVGADASGDEVVVSLRR